MQKWSSQREPQPLEFFPGPAAIRHLFPRSAPPIVASASSVRFSARKMSPRLPSLAATDLDMPFLKLGPEMALQEFGLALHCRRKAQEKTFCSALESPRSSACTA